MVVMWRCGEVHQCFSVQHVLSVADCLVLFIAWTWQKHEKIDSQERLKPPSSIID